MDIFNFNETFGSIMVVFLIFLGLIFSIIWGMLPFFIVGIKPLLRKIIEQQESIRSLLEKIYNETKYEGREKSSSRPDSFV